MPPVAIHITHEVASDRDQTEDKDGQVCPLASHTINLLTVVSSRVGQHWEIEMDDVPSPTVHTTRGRMQTTKATAL